MIKFLVRFVEPGQTECRTRVVHQEVDPGFDLVLAQARELMKQNHVSSVTIESSQCLLTLLHHNEFNSYLILGSPKPNRRSWGRTWIGTREKRFGNNVRVLTRWHSEKGFAAYAIYNDKILNRFDAMDEQDLEQKYRLLCGAWKNATSGNLKDEAQDAPLWNDT